MKSTILFPLSIFLNVSCAIPTAFGLPSVNDHSVTDAHHSRSVPSGCTVITVVKGNTVFFGGTDAFNNPD